MAQNKIGSLLWRIRRKMQGIIIINRKVMMREMFPNGTFRSLGELIIYYSNGVRYKYKLHKFECCCKFIPASFTLEAKWVECKISDYILHTS